MTSSHLKVLFVYQKAFSKTGGLENFNKYFVYALLQLEKKGLIQPSFVSGYDHEIDASFGKSDHFNSGFGYKIWFFIQALWLYRKTDVVILGHSHLRWIGIIGKFLYPSKKMILNAHGIEIWDKKCPLDKYFLRKCDLILPVSRYTRDKIIENAQLPLSRFWVFHNTIGPFFKPVDFNRKQEYLKARYKIRKRKVILTITRLTAFEKNKNYDLLLSVMKELIQKREDVVLLIGGRYTDDEYQRLQHKTKILGLDENVQVIGFIDDRELQDHYALADVFVMPSKKEGFGIVFIEAAACGTHVVGGNKDGSVDALQNGALGTLVDPDDLQDILKGVVDALDHPFSLEDKMLLSEKCIDCFGYPKYENNLEEALQHLNSNIKDQ